MKNHILLIADGRSPITKRWIEILKRLNFRISLVSTYPFSLDVEVENIFILPVAFSAAAEQKTVSDQRGNSTPSQNWKKKIIQNARPLAMNVRYWLGPYTLRKHQKRLLEIIAQIKPDLVHALRVPYEGMLARVVPDHIPLVVSIWGNDFTLHANANKKMGQLTRQVMERANGVLADVHRDIALAHQWGLSNYRPTMVVPGAGGIHLDEILLSKTKDIRDLHIPDDALLIINPRGVRAYARTDTFFQSIPGVIEEYPKSIFICPDMKGKPEAEKWIERLNIQQHVRLLPALDQHTLWALFHQSPVSLSITTHDGTPNTLLEAMACGCFPIAGDIDSLREWITPGVNGFLVEPDNPHKLSEAIIAALDNLPLRQKAAEFNLNIINSKAEVGQVQDRLSKYYKIFLKSKTHSESL
ncbi:MAG TPA: glycosyltransferase family 4 protein [Anaerolineaceae bacterium]|nr:glycosyltransferase family 4 protein [Anaerolineaceae bacterium]